MTTRGQTELKTCPQVAGAAPGPGLGRVPSGPGPQGSRVLPAERSAPRDRYSEHIMVKVNPNMFKRRYRIRLPLSGPPTSLPGSVVLLRGPRPHTSPRVSACSPAGSTHAEPEGGVSVRGLGALWPRWRVPHTLTQKGDFVKVTLSVVWRSSQKLACFR